MEELEAIAAEWSHACSDLLCFFCLFVARSLIMGGSRGEAVMVVVQRNEVSRNRLLYILTIILSAVVLSAVAVNFLRSSEAIQGLLVLLAPIAFVARVLSLVRLPTPP